MDPTKFRHRTQVKVRNYEINWQGIVHDANYLLYFETGRVDYLQSLGLNFDIDMTAGEPRMVVVRNEINYCSPAHFNELITVHTRISYVRNTSFTFEGILDNAETGRRIAESVSVHVWLNCETGEPARIPDSFREIVRKFEGENIISADIGAAT